MSIFSELERLKDDKEDKDDVEEQSNDEQLPADNEDKTAEVDDDDSGTDTDTGGEEGSSGDHEEEDREKPEEETEKLDNVAAARLRRENAALQKQLDDARQKPKEQPKEEAKTNDDPEPDPDDIEEHLKWQNRQLSKQVEEISEWKQNFTQRQQEQQVYERAIQNFNRMEREFKSATPDYDDAADHMIKRMVDSAASLYPNAPQDQVQQFVSNQILQLADSYAAKGLNPVEELYGLAKEKFGYTGEKKEEKKASVKTVAENKKKSVTSLGSGGNDSKTYNMKAMTPGKWAKLSQTEREKYLASSSQ